VKNINGCCEHSAKINFLITHEINNKKSLFIAALDYKDAFGSVSHQLMKINLKKLGVPARLRNLIMDSYDKINVRI
jgi:hypothetical protein